MMTAKIGGSSRPCTKRQGDPAPVTSCASAAPAIGTTTASIAAVMTRLRPSASAIAPVNGAVSAIASALAVMIVLMVAALAPVAGQFRQQSLRRIPRLRNAQNPAVSDGELASSRAASMHPNAWPDTWTPSFQFVSHTVAERLSTCLLP